MKLFPLGQVCATPGAIRLLTSLAVDPSHLLKMHQNGNWGTLCEEDRKLNDAAVKNGDRILSCYVLKGEEKVWIITEWDRSVTTILLPSEY